MPARTWGRQKAVAKNKSEKKKAVVVADTPSLSPAPLPCAPAPAPILVSIRACCCCCVPCLVWQGSVRWRPRSVTGLALLAALACVWVPTAHAGCTAISVTYGATPPSTLPVDNKDYYRASGTATLIAIAASGGACH